MTKETDKPDLEQADDIETLDSDDVEILDQEQDRDRDSAPEILVSDTVAGAQVPIQEFQEKQVRIEAMKFAAANQHKTEAVVSPTSADQRNLNEESSGKVRPPEVSPQASQNTPPAEVDRARFATYPLFSYMNAPFRYNEEPDRAAAKTYPKESTNKTSEAVRIALARVQAYFLDFNEDFEDEYAFKKRGQEISRLPGLLKIVSMVNYRLPHEFYDLTSNFALGKIGKEYKKVLHYPQKRRELAAKQCEYVKESAWIEAIKELVTKYPELADNIETSKHDPRVQKIARVKEENAQKNLINELHRIDLEERSSKHQETLESYLKQSLFLRLRVVFDKSLRLTIDRKLEQWETALINSRKKSRIENLGDSFRNKFRNTTNAIRSTALRKHSSWLGAAALVAATGALVPMKCAGENSDSGDLQFEVATFNDTPIDGSKISNSDQAPFMAAINNEGSGGFNPGRLMEENILDGGSDADTSKSIIDAEQQLAASEITEGGINICTEEEALTEEEIKLAQCLPKDHTKDPRINWINPKSIDSFMYDPWTKTMAVNRFEQIKRLRELTGQTYNVGQLPISQPQVIAKMQKPVKYERYAAAETHSIKAKSYALKEAKPDLLDQLKPCEPTKQAETAITNTPTVNAERPEQAEQTAKPEKTVRFSERVLEIRTKLQQILARRSEVYKQTSITGRPRTLDEVLVTGANVTTPQVTVNCETETGCDPNNSAKIDMIASESSTALADCNDEACLDSVAANLSKATEILDKDARAKYSLLRVNFVFQLDKMKFGLDQKISKVQTLLANKHYSETDNFTADRRSGGKVIREDLVLAKSLENAKLEQNWWKQMRSNWVNQSDEQLKAHLETMNSLNRRLDWIVYQVSYGQLVKL